MLNRLYLWLGMIVPASYALSSILGYQLFDAPRDKVDPHAPGSVHHNHSSFFFFGGFHGGK